MESIEFSIEDILNMHRHWITKLYIEDEKSDLEILELLQERRFIVRLSQIRRCIEDWGLVRQGIATAPAILPEVSLDEEWEQSPPTPSYTASDPGEIDVYSKKPLPSIPSLDSSVNGNKRASSDKSFDFDNDNDKKKRKGLSTDRLKVTCHHGPLPSQVHEVETTLCHFPKGPTPLETYRGKKQNHEMVALGFNVDRTPPFFYRRSGDVRADSHLRERPPPRKMSEIVLRKKKS